MSGDCPASGEAQYLARPVSRIGGELVVPGDKSISHRAVMLGSVARGHTRIRGFLRSDDCLATMAAMRALGVEIEEQDDDTLLVGGVGLDGLRAPTSALDLGNSGTAMRLLAGLLATQSFETELTGDASLRVRPMERVAEPLRAMGAQVQTRDGRAPLKISGGQLHGVEWTLRVASAQVKSALLLAGLGAAGRTSVRSPATTRDHTERMLLGMGAPLEVSAGGLVVAIDGPAELKGIDFDVPGDFSSAAFFIVAGCLAAPEGVLIRNVGINPTRTGLLDVLRAMGAAIELRNERSSGAEPVADVFARQSELHGIEVPPEWVPLAIDELPVLFVAAAAASGRTVFTGAEELRHKESDRLGVMARGLEALGIRTDERADGLAIEGGHFASGTIESHGDHRVAMAFAVAALVGQGPVCIRDTAMVATSFPNFAAVARDIGFDIDSRAAAG